MNRVNVGATIEQQRHHVCRSADDRTVQRMTASAVDVVDERWLLIEEGAYARQLAGFGSVMDRMILGHGRRHEPSRRINHVRGIIPAAAIHEAQPYTSADSRTLLTAFDEPRGSVRGGAITGSVDGVSPFVESNATLWMVSLQGER